MFIGIEPFMRLRSVRSEFVYFVDRIILDYLRVTPNPLRRQAFVLVLI